MTYVTLYAPDIYPRKHAEIRAYTVAAFRVAQGSDQLSLVAMRKELLRFLVKDRALRYWTTMGWLRERDGSVSLTAEGLAQCQQALAGQLASHNTGAGHIAFWIREFTLNAALPRRLLVDA
jgi:hypothetical protein